MDQLTLAQNMFIRNPMCNDWRNANARRSRKVVAHLRCGLRALSIETGEELWKDKLPVPAQSTPMTYQVREGGKQYVVTCAGGHGKLGVPLRDHVIAYALP